MLDSQRKKTVVMIGGKSDGTDGLSRRSVVRKKMMYTNPSSFVVFYEFTYGKSNKRLSQLHTHSSLTCFSEETIETGKIY